MRQCANTPSHIEKQRDILSRCRLVLELGFALTAFLVHHGFFLDQQEPKHCGEGDTDEQELSRMSGDVICHDSLLCENEKAEKSEQLFRTLFFKRAYSNTNPANICRGVDLGDDEERQFHNPKRLHVDGGDAVRPAELLL